MIMPGMPINKSCVDAMMIILAFEGISDEGVRI
jgi:hypothetical protein